MLVNYMVDELGEVLKEKMFGEAVLIDINKTSKTIPNDIRTIDDLRQLLANVKKTSE